MDFDDIFRKDEREEGGFEEDEREEYEFEDDEFEDYEPVQPPRPAILYSETIRHETASRETGRFRRRLSAAVLLTLIGAAALGFGYGAGTRFAVDFWLPRMASDANELRTFTLNVGYLSADDRPQMFSFADVIEIVEPAVVRVFTLRGVTGANFHRRIESTGQGSGMLFHETPNRFFMVTNAHVIAGADEVFVSIEDSPPIQAQVVGIDYDIDLAVISVSRVHAHRAGVNSVSLVTFGDSDAMRVGDMVIAIGNALGEGISSTNGILSAKDRMINIDGMTYRVLQTNAAINHGNSGGPLAALTGEVIGMNTAKLKEGWRNDFVEGMGFSIPSNDMIPSIEAIMRGERQNQRAFLGVVMTNAPDEAERAGAFIAEVIDGTAAAAAGLLEGDIVVAFNDAQISGSSDLSQSIVGARPGDSVVLRVFRETEYIYIEVALGSDM